MTLGSHILNSIAPEAKLVADESGPMPYAVWIGDEIIGAGWSVWQAIVAAAAGALALEESARAPLAWAPMTNSEWDGFGGAESFGDGSRPKIAEIFVDGIRGVAIHDFAGISIMAYHERLERANEIWLPHSHLGKLCQVMKSSDLTKLDGAMVAG